MKLLEVNENYLEFKYFPMHSQIVNYNYGMSLDCIPFYLSQNYLMNKLFKFSVYCYFVTIFPY